MRLTYKGFVAEVYFSAHTDGFHGETTNSIDVIAFQVTDLPDVEPTFHEAVDGYLKMVREWEMSYREEGTFA